jgi:membrane protease YdiL (CAAX protease family)
MSETMGTGASVTRTHRAFAAALVVVLLLWNNVVVPRLPSGSYALVNGAAAGLLLVAARSTGLSWEQLGLSRGGLPSGLRWGAASFAVVTAAYATALAIPALRPLLADDRVLGLGAREVATEVLVRIPLGTVLWEEVAFRGVLLAALLRVLPVRRAVVGAAAVFGLWHIRPTLGGVAANDLTDTPWLLGLAVLVGCTATGAAGLLFTWLRLRSGSLLAPAMLHLATNAVGVLAATVAHRVG